MKNNIENKINSDFKKLLWYIITNIFLLSKEFDWWSSWKTFENNIKLQWKVFHNHNWENIKVTKYFIKNEIEEYSENLIVSLEKILIELDLISQRIEKLSESQKEEIVRYIKWILKEKEDIAGFKFPMKFRDILFAELWIDYVDDIWEVKNETVMLLEVLMLKK